MTPQPPDDVSDIATLIDGVWLPKQERHLTNWMVNSKGRHVEHGVMTYQWSKQQAALNLVKHYRPDYPEAVMIDVGAHVGLWSMWWVRVMGAVLAYEPVPQFARIWHVNVDKNRSTLRPDVPATLLPYALGDAPGTVTLSIDPENTGDTHITPPGAVGDVPTIGVVQEVLSFDAPRHLRGRRVAMVKIDCEGWELRVVKGGADLFRKDRPIIVVEQKRSDRYGLAQTEAVEYLKRECTYVQHSVMSGDYFMVPKELT